MRTRLNLESLDQRLTPSATTLDLTTAGSTATAPNGAIVEQSDTQPTGTGVIHSFLRLQGAAKGGGLELGYNTDARPLQFDENKSPQFTRSLQAADVPTVLVNGALYREFLLDINQKSSSPLLSLDEVRIYFSDQSNLSHYDASALTLGGVAPSFDLDSAGDVSVLLNANLGSGSGSGDMFLLVPQSAFAGADANSFVYLYSKFGEQQTATANGGFEEWAVRTLPPAVPPATSTISGFVFFDADNDGSFDHDDTGLAGVVVTLTGTDLLGNDITLTATTAADGSYSFTGLAAGTYSLLQGPLPADDPFFAEMADVGTIDGTQSGVGGMGEIDQIVLGDNENGINYDFGNHSNGG